MDVAASEEGIIEVVDKNGRVMIVPPAPPATVVALLRGDHVLIVGEVNSLATAVALAAARGKGPPLITATGQFGFSGDVSLEGALHTNIGEDEFCPSPTCILASMKRAM